MASLVSLRLAPTRKELRTFGIVAALLLIGATLLRWHGHMIWQSAAGGGGAALLLVLAIAAPQWLKPLYVGISVVTFPIGWVVSHILLGALFFGIITPLGLLFRLVGRDRMGRRVGKHAPSYFLPRSSTKDKRRYFRQY